MKKLVVSLAALAAIALVAGCSSTATSTAAKADSAASKKADSDGIAHVDWAAVESAMANGAILVDARGAESFASGHIAGAVNIPSRSTDAGTWGKLPADKNTKIITYCGGPACSASYKAAKKCKEMGYTDVAEYKGGYPEWKKMKGGK